MRVPLNFLFSPKSSAVAEMLSVAGHSVPLAIVHNRRARRYVLRVRPDGSARVTVPRGGSIVEARQFAGRHRRWLEKQLLHFASRPRHPREWTAGAEIFFRGDRVKIEPGEKAVRVGDEMIPVANVSGDLRPAIEKHFRQLALKELPPRVLEWAARHQLAVKSISIRNQKTRWGSCSARGQISLNWRLVQTPVFVCDYIILHELMHLRHLNHSPAFWREVRLACPDFVSAKNWLRQNPGLLR